MLAYRFKAGFLAKWTLDGLLGRRRTFTDDAQQALQPYRDSVTVSGIERVPANGPFIVVVNHYQRAGMGAEWTGIVVTAALAESVPGLDLRWMHTDGRGGYRLMDRYAVPPIVSARFMAWVARRYG